MCRCSVSLLVLLAGISLVGCGGSQGPATYPVQGTITFDGVPVAQGQIIFRPVDTQLLPQAVNFTDGKYTVRLNAGQQAVSITATREVPDKFDTSNPGEQTPVVEQYIPDKYNARTELQIDVSKGGQAEFNFDLTSN